MKKLDGLPAKTDPGQEPILQTDQFRIKKTVDTWADVSPSSAASPHQYRYIPVGLDSYSMVDLVSISFVKSLGLSPCTRPKHQHVEPALEGVGQIQPKTYGFYQDRKSTRLNSSHLGISYAV